MWQPLCVSPFYIGLSSKILWRAGVGPLLYKHALFFCWCVAGTCQVMHQKSVKRSSPDFQSITPWLWSVCTKDHASARKRVRDEAFPRSFFNMITSPPRLPSRCIFFCVASSSPRLHHSACLATSDCFSNNPREIFMQKSSHRILPLHPSKTPLPFSFQRFFKEQLSLQNEKKLPP